MQAIASIKYDTIWCFALNIERNYYLKTIVLNFLKKFALRLENDIGLSFDALGTDGDHVHVFVGAAPKYAPSNVMQIIKSITAKNIFKKYPEIKKQLWGGEFWSDGGYIGTVGDGVTADIIKTYVEKQGTKEEKEGYNQMKLLEFE